MLRHFISIFIICLLVYSCGSSNKTTVNPEPIPEDQERSLEDAVVISNDSLEYEIIIYDPAFSTYLNSIAKPDWFYSQDFLETKNIFFVTEWNIRYNNPLQYGDFYASFIEYSPHIDYGLDVNYKLYNYFLFIDYQYGVRLW